MANCDPTEQFTNRVDNYVKYRPSYPPQVLDTLQTHCSLNAESIVADVGSGTGIFTTLLLERGYKVFAVEPNENMRAASEKDLSGNPLFHSTTGKAEDTGLDANSIDLITAAQAFHWFNRDKAKREFTRVLKPDGWLAMIWNVRTTGQQFQKAYENVLVQSAPEYKKPMQNYRAGGLTNEFFGEEGAGRFTFAYQQKFDFDGLVGITNSASYVPTIEDPALNELMSKLKAIFDEHAIDGQIALDYETRLYVGRLKAS